MAYLTTIDERYRDGFIFEAGELDAFSRFPTDTFLAEDEAAYGTLVYDFTRDIDVYGLGVLAPGQYELRVSDQTWDFANFDYASVLSFSLLDASGAAIETKFGSSVIAFDVEVASTYYLDVAGEFYKTAQYSASYSRVGDLQLPVHAFSSVSYALASNQLDLTLLGAARVHGTGNARDNSLWGNGAANILKGGLGDDYLNGAGGDDRMYGGAGADIYVVDATGDRVIETAGDETDTVFSEVSYALPERVEQIFLEGPGDIDATGNAQNNDLIGSTGDNAMFGGGGGDVLEGHAGDDLLDGGSGADRMEGGAGDDRYVVNSAHDEVAEARKGGDDRVNSSVTFRLPGDVEDLTLSGTGTTTGVGNSLANEIRGNTGANELLGGGRDDLLRGGAGSDRLFGGTGSDRLYGEAGKDHLSGGSGDDHFIFRQHSDAGNGKHRDTVADFQLGVDTLDVSAIDAGASRVGNQSFRFLGAESFNGIERELRYKSGVVSGDVDGDGRADFQIELANDAALAAADILL